MKNQYQYYVFYTNDSYHIHYIFFYIQVLHEILSEVIWWYTDILNTFVSYKFVIWCFGDTWIWNGVCFVESNDTYSNWTVWPLHLHESFGSLTGCQRINVQWMLGCVGHDPANLGSVRKCWVYWQGGGCRYVPWPWLMGVIRSLRIFISGVSGSSWFVLYMTPWTVILKHNDTFTSPKI